MICQRCGGSGRSRDLDGKRTKFNCAWCDGEGSYPPHIRIEHHPGDIDNGWTVSFGSETLFSIEDHYYQSTHGKTFKRDGEERPFTLATRLPGEAMNRPTGHRDLHKAFLVGLGRAIRHAENPDSDEFGPWVR